MSARILGFQGVGHRFSSLHRSTTNNQRSQSQYSNLHTIITQFIRANCQVY